MYSTRSKLDYYDEENNVFKDMAVEKGNGASPAVWQGVQMMAAAEARAGHCPVATVSHPSAGRTKGWCRVRGPVLRDGKELGLP